ncbi:hypothetical protein [Streptomyces sp. NBC_00519]|uniref:hypothetical protein n=1 Tax=Streptomyces sp. NBC_00519 TaxID=2975764 RepID=UPI0030E461C6
MKPQRPTQPGTSPSTRTSAHAGTHAGTPPTAPHESELTPLLTAWDLAHPGLSDPEWRHVLDEIAHPRTTQAFHRLAEAAA